MCFQQFNLGVIISDFKDFDSAFASYHRELTEFFIFIVRKLNNIPEWYIFLIFISRDYLILVYFCAVDLGNCEYTFIKAQQKVTFIKLNNFPDILFKRGLT